MRGIDGRVFTTRRDTLGMHPDERCDAWGAAHELAVMVYRAAGAWPDHERYGLAAQARRAAFLAALYLADDPGVPEATRQRRYARGLDRLAYLRYALVLAHELEYLDGREWAMLDRMHGRVVLLVRRLTAAASGGSIERA